MILEETMAKRLLERWRRLVEEWELLQWGGRFDYPVSSLCRDW